MLIIARLTYRIADDTEKISQKNLKIANLSFLLLEGEHKPRITLENIGCDSFTESTSFKPILINYGKQPVDCTFWVLAYNLKCKTKDTEEIEKCVYNVSLYYNKPEQLKFDIIKVESISDDKIYIKFGYDCNETGINYFGNFSKKDIYNYGREITKEGNNKYYRYFCES